MFSFLKNHPFAVEAFFESSLVLTFAAPREQVQPLLPECLEADTFNDKWAFIAVAMVQTKKLRPKGFPAFTGNDFFLIGYRVFVRYINNAGKRLRGLYILKSETDKKKMMILGNIFTHYKYTTVPVTRTRLNDTVQIQSPGNGFEVFYEDTDGTNVPLPAGSPFTDWKEARRFAGPLPFTFTYDPGKKEVLIIEGVRENWTPQPVKVNSYRFPFLENLPGISLTFANAFIIRNVPYYWKKGKTEIWQNADRRSGV